MPTRNVNLTPDLDDFVLTRVESGRYANPSEMVQAALRALDREERVNEALFGTPHVLSEEESLSKIAESDVFRSLWNAQVQSSAVPDAAGPQAA
jgi:antitoxin ParD1/3/4